MAARVWAASATDGHLFHSDNVSLSLLINRRAGTLRVFDFRAGVSASKRTFVLSTARRESIERVFIVVEREEVQTWNRLGLAREGTIPAFYKRSDGFLLGTVVDLAPAPTTHRLRNAQGACDVDAAERVLRSAKNLAHKTEPAQVRVVPIRADEAGRALTHAQHAGTALTGFEPFGRDPNRCWFAVSQRGRPLTIISAEIQTCFDHALIEFMTPPRDDRERAAFRSALDAVALQLRQRDVIGMFAWSPTDDLSLASVFVGAGFRRTGVLARHLATPRGRKDAFLWSRKHPLPGEG